MERRGWVMLRVLINRFNPKTGDVFYKFLSKESVAELKEQKVTEKDLSPILQQPQKGLSKIHYSWIAPAIEKLPKSLRSAACASLTDEQMKGLQVEGTPLISSLQKAFLQNELYMAMKIGEHLPLEYLPASPLTPLAHWKKAQLLELIDCLGLHDLANEMRQIVDRKHLENIFTCLTQEQAEYLKTCLRQKQKLTAPKLGIDPREKNCPHLLQVVHKRGLARLAKALSGQHADFVWHLSHTLDTGRGALLLKEFSPDEVPQVTDILRSQVLEIMKWKESV